jgi:hypothetical protein
MIPVRGSNRTKPNRPPERNGEVMRARADGVPEQRLNAGIRAVPTAGGNCLPWRTAPDVSPGMPQRRFCKAPEGIQRP